MLWADHLAGESCIMGGGGRGLSCFYQCSVDNLLFVICRVFTSVLSCI